MKKIMLVIILGIVSILSMGCIYDDSIVGKWEDEEGDTWYFHEDGTFTGSFVDGELRYSQYDKFLNIGGERYYVEYVGDSDTMRIESIHGGEPIYLHRVEKNIDWWVVGPGIFAIVCIVLAIILFKYGKKKKDKEKEYERYGVERKDDEIGYVVIDEEIGEG